jgi:hypothetical protein
MLALPRHCLKIQIHLERCYHLHLATLVPSPKVCRVDENLQKSENGNFCKIHTLLWIAAYQIRTCCRGKALHRLTYLHE